jgi:hypothetical protein
MKVIIDKKWRVDFPSLFFVKPYCLRLDLSKEEFGGWKTWYLKYLTRCNKWFCATEEELHGIAELCPRSSEYEQYVEKREIFLKSNLEQYYPIYDPLKAYHIPELQYIEKHEDKEIPVVRDEYSLWPYYFPKRSCMTCIGAFGDISIRICKHLPPYSSCDDDCFDKKWKCFCPIINKRRKKEGWNVDRTLEKYYKNPELIKTLDSESEIPDFKNHAPKIIQDYLSQFMEEDENGTDESNE